MNKNARYLEYPLTVKSLVEELKNLCDDYIKKEISEKELRFYIEKWKETCGENFLKDGIFNSTLQQRIGGKRIKLISNVLNIN